MMFGIAVGNGWFGLILELSEDLEKLDPSLVATQVKEKFGTLRIYLTQSKLEMLQKAEDMVSFEPQSINERIRERVRLAENQSACICEKCGAPGKLYRGGCWHVACGECEMKDSLTG